MHDGIIAAGGIGRGLTQLDQKMLQNIESRGQEQFFLVAIVVRQQSKGTTPARSEIFLNVVST